MFYTYLTSSKCHRFGMVGCLFSITTSLRMSSKLGSGGTRLWNGTSYSSAFPAVCEGMERKEGRGEEGGRGREGGGGGGGRREEGGERGGGGGGGGRKGEKGRRRRRVDGGGGKEGGGRGGKEVGEGKRRGRRLTIILRTKQLDSLIEEPSNKQRQ